MKRIFLAIIGPAVAIAWYALLLFCRIYHAAFWLRERKQRRLERQHAMTASTPAHPVAACCRGEHCSLCQSDATHKVGEEPLHDTERRKSPTLTLTAYICCRCYGALFGPFARQLCGLEEPRLPSAG